MVVWDSASMKIRIKDTTVTISEITNFPSRATPTQIVYPMNAQYFCSGSGWRNKYYGRQWKGRAQYFPVSCRQAFRFSVLLKVGPIT